MDNVIFVDYNGSRLKIWKNKDGYCQLPTAKSVGFLSRSLYELFNVRESGGGV